MAYKKFAKDRHRPAGNWVQATPLLKVAGVAFRKKNVKAFAARCEKSERQGRIYGLAIERQPNNPHDANAIAVIGIAETKGWFRTNTREFHLGYVPKDEAEIIVSEFIDREIPVGVELYEIVEGIDDYFEVKFFVLAPPGNSLSARKRRG